MADPSLDLPPPEDSFDAKLLSDIREYGWHCVLVSDEAHPEHAEASKDAAAREAYDAELAYTAGLSLTRNHPELALLGRWPDPHGVLIAVVHLIEEGQTFQPGDHTEEVLPRHPVRFDPVHLRWRVQLLTYADWVTGRRGYDALQVVIPDAEGRWPELDEYSGPQQPLLAHEELST